MRDALGDFEGLAEKTVCAEGRNVLPIAVCRKKTLDHERVLQHVAPILPFALALAKEVNGLLQAQVLDRVEPGCAVP